MCVGTLVLVGSLMIIGVVLAIVLQNPTVQKSAMEMAYLSHTKDGKGIPLDFSHISGLFPYKFTMHGMRIVDPVGNKIEAGTAKIHVALLSVFKGLIEVHSVVMESPQATKGSNYVEDNVDYTQAEIDESVRMANRRSRVEIWPYLPFGIQINNLDIRNFEVPVPALAGKPFSVSGSVDFRRMGGDFFLKLWIVGAGYNVSFNLGGISGMHHVTIDAQVYNTSVLCVRSGEQCNATLDVSSLFYNEVAPYKLETMTDLSLNTDGTWSDLLQFAFPSKNVVNVNNLLKGVVKARALDYRSAISSVELVFHVDPNRTLFIDDGRIYSPLLRQSRPFEFSALASRSEPYVWMFSVEKQRIVFPEPIGASSVAFQVDHHLAGIFEVSKYDLLVTAVQWTINSTFVYSRNETMLHFPELEIDVFDNRITGSGMVKYDAQGGVNAVVLLHDDELGADGAVRFSSYTPSDTIERQYQLHVGFSQERFSTKRVNVSQVRITADIFQIPSNTQGSATVSFGELNYGNGVFIMNNASIGAKSAGEPYGAWEITASSENDLRTKFSMYLSGTPTDRVFRGSVAPFHATLYGTHSVWTEDPSELDFDYYKMSYGFHTSLHANQQDPKRKSLDVVASNRQTKLIINEDISLFNTVFPQKYQGTGLIQGLVEIEHVNGESYPSQIDLCWNNGNLFAAPTSDAAGYAVSHSIFACVRGHVSNGWKIDSPPATFVMDSPAIGLIQLKANITASRQQREGSRSVVQLDSDIEFVMRDSQDQAQFFQGGAITAETSFDINI
jgi:hypothetical protein